MVAKLFFLAGEPSGDRQASLLIDALKKESPHLELMGIGGPEMAKRGLHSLLPFEQFQLMGFGAIASALPRLFQQMKRLRTEVLLQKPEAVILVDYPGFNLRFARSLRHNGYEGQIIQLISPTVWAWGKGRIHTLARYYDLLLTIFPFEAKYFANTQLDVHYIGHPLVQQITPSAPSHPPILGIFPGSRRLELELNLPHLLKTARLFCQRHPELKPVISCANQNLRSLLETAASDMEITSNSYELMAKSSTAIAVSGTVTLELALHHTPTLVLYQLTRFNRLLAGHILRIRLPHYCIVNIIAGKTIFPELIREPYTPEKSLALLEKIYGIDRESTIAACCKIARQLSRPKGLQEAAQEILSRCQELAHV